MAKYKKGFIVAVAVAATVGVAAIGSSEYFTRSSGAHVEATDNVRVVDDRELPEQWAINAAYGRGALNNLQAALAEIANDNAEEARKGVAVAQSLLAKIKPESTRTTTSVSIPSDTESNVILIHAEVRLIGDADPVESVQSKLDRIRRELSMVDHEAIVTALESLNVPLAYTRVDLPLVEAITLVDEALQALDFRDTGRARAKLMEIGNALRFETVQVGTGSSEVESNHEDDAG